MHKYTEKEVEFLRVNHKAYSLVDLTREFNDEFGLNQTNSAIRNALAKRGLRSGRKSGYKKGYKPLPYTHEQIEFIEEEYKRFTTPELTLKFNEHFQQDRTEHAIRSAIKRHEIVCIRKRGMSPREVKALGYERICSQTGSIMVKIDEPDPYMSSKTRHRHKHKVIWEEVNGPMPDGHCLRFLDGDKMNCKLENLGLFTRGENMHLNHLGFNNAPDELRETIILVAKLRAKATERKRELTEAGDV